MNEWFTAPATEQTEPTSSPLSVSVLLSSGDDSMRMSHLKVGSAADIPLDIGEFDLSQLTASLTTPSGREEPCLLKMLRNGHVGECGCLGGEWTGRVTGSPS